MDIDFVVTWVGGADPEWLKQKRAYQVNQVAQMSLEEESKQFREWDTIRYWFRAVEKYAPWVRTIHFVTWGHFPDWLDTENPNAITQAVKETNKGLPNYKSIQIIRFRETPFPRSGTGKILRRQSI